eukprot:8857020-Pyramimonas_sp.AAC.1
MSLKIGGFAKAARRYKAARRLELQGAQSAGTCGFQVHGAFGQRLAQARRRLGLAAADALQRCWRPERHSRIQASSSPRSV